MIRTVNFTVSINKYYNVIDPLYYLFPLWFYTKISVVTGGVNIELSNDNNG